MLTDRLFPEIIRPALSDRKGYCVFIGTPQGMNNNFYDTVPTCSRQQRGLVLLYEAKASATEVVDPG
jgi:phage terminase large subunit